MKSFTIHGIDAEGNIISEYTSKTGHGISEIEAQFDDLKKKLYNEEIDSILIGRE
jgi:hypothetical protein